MGVADCDRMTQTYNGRTLNTERTRMNLGQTSESNHHPLVPGVNCEACHSVLQSPSRQTVSYLLLDQFTVPLLGCEDHLEQFRAMCGLTSEGAARLLSHHPAGGISCPSCRLATGGNGHVFIPVNGGGTVILGCRSHQATIAERFETGRRTHQQLSSSIGSASGSSG